MTEMYFTQFRRLEVQNLVRMVRGELSSRLQTSSCVLTQGKRQVLWSLLYKDINSIPLVATLMI